MLCTKQIFTDICYIFKYLLNKNLVEYLLTLKMISSSLSMRTSKSNTNVSYERKLLKDKPIKNEQFSLLKSKVG